MNNTIKIIKKYSWCIVEAIGMLTIGIIVTISASFLLVFQAIAWPFKYVVAKCITFDREYDITERV